MVVLATARVFFLSSVIVLTAASTCQSPWISAGGSCFYITENRLNNDKAKAACASIGGRLATFNEDDFNAFKQNIGTGDYWIGLELRNDVWVWNDGTPTGEWVESNWRYGEPYLGESNARVMHTKRWAGLYYTFHSGYICKKGMLPTPTTTTTTTTTPTTTTTTPKTTTTTPTTTTTTPTITATTQTLTKTTPRTTTTTPTTTPNATTSTLATTTTPTSNTTATIKSTTQSTLETTPHGKPHEGRSETSRSTTAGTPLIESGLVDKPEKNLAIWISMGVVGICGSVAMVIGIVCCIRARQPKQKSPEKGDPHNTDLDKTGKDNPEYADLSDANTLSNGKTQNIIYYEDSVLNTVKTEDGADVYEEIRDSKVPEVEKSAEANLDDPKVDECGIDVTTSVAPPPYDSVCGNHYVT